MVSASLRSTIESQPEPVEMWRQRGLEVCDDRWDLQNKRWFRLCDLFIFSIASPWRVRLILITFSFRLLCCFSSFVFIDWYEYSSFINVKHWHLYSILPVVDVARSPYDALLTHSSNSSLESPMSSGFGCEIRLFCLRLWTLQTKRLSTALATRVAHSYLLRCEIILCWIILLFDSVNEIFEEEFRWSRSMTSKLQISGNEMTLKVIQSDI